MPIYEYVCSACDHRTDILHGLHDPGPHFCPSCGREGTMKKAIATPTIIYKGSGWAKKDRRATSASHSTKSESKSDTKPDAKAEGSTSKDSTSGDGSGADKASTATKSGGE